MARLDPSIRHAITPPEFGEDKLHREKLVDRLHGEISGKLVAVAAPAGYGKTSLLADFAANTDIPIVWIRVSEQDQDLIRFASVLLAALEKRFRRLRGQFDLREYSQESPQVLARALVALLANEVPETFVIIIDDVQLLHSSEPVLDFLDTFILQLPEQATVFAAGREVLEVSLARLMAQGSLAGYGPHDLAFSREEIERLIEIRTGEPPREHLIEDLLDQTQGWITGIVLSQASGSNIVLQRDLPEELVYEYLASVVLNRQPDDIRRFMIDASVLPVMTEDTCDAILERNDSGSLLRELSDRGLFVTVSSTQPRIYEFHPLFRSLLLETLQAQGQDRFEELQVRAAEELRDEDPDAAFRLLMDAQRIEGAKDIVREEAEKYLWLGRSATLRSWSDVLGSVGEAVPTLEYCIARLEANDGNRSGAIAILDGINTESISTRLRAKISILRATQLVKDGGSPQMDAVIERADRDTEAAGDPELFARLKRLHALKHWVLDNDTVSAISCIKEAVDRFQELDNKDLLAAALQDEAKYLVESGDLDEGRTVALDTVQIASKLKAPITRQAALNNLAYIKYLEGEFDAALGHFSEARAIAKRSGIREREAVIVQGQGELFSDAGLTYQAAALFQEMLEIASSLGNNQLLAECCLVTSILHRRNGGYQLAREWLARASEFGGQNFTPLERIQEAILVGISDPKKGAERLERLVEDSNITRAPRESSLSRLFLAVFKAKLGQVEEAEQVFRGCLEDCSLRGAIQFVSAELAYMDDSTRWLRDTFRNDPVFEQIQRRISVLEVFTHHYRDRPAADSESHELRIRALGAAEIILKGEPISDLKPQTLELLVYLVDKGSAGRDELGEVFWEDLPSGRQSANLHMSIYDIRRILGKDAIRLDGTTYRIDDEMSVSYDVEEFEQAVKVVNGLPSGDPRRLFALTEATSLYSGKFMPDYFAEWVQDRRRRLELKYLDIAAEHAEEALLRNQPRRALDSLRFALNVDPFRDDLNLRYLQVLHQLGRRIDVITHYQQYENLIREEFGLEPPADARELHNRVVGGE